MTESRQKWKIPKMGIQTVGQTEQPHTTLNMAVRH